MGRKSGELRNQHSLFRRHETNGSNKRQFVALLEKPPVILMPNDALIVKYQSGSVPISEVWHSFNALPAQVLKMHLDGHVSSKETDYLIKLPENQFKFMYGKAHGLSFLLDTCFIGEDLSATKRAELGNILIESNSNGQPHPIDDTRRELLCLPFTAYMISAIKEKKDNSFRFKMLLKGCKTPLRYWQSDGAAWPDLQMISIKLFTRATSSAASERNFSTMGLVHIKLRNSSAPQMVQMLTYVKSNYATFADCIYVSDGDGACSSSEDEGDDEVVESGYNNGDIA